MTDIFLSDDVAFLEGRAFEFTRSDLRYVVGKDRADGFLNRNGLCHWSLIFVNGVTHGNLHLKN
jgi:hypothetical protein